MNKLLLIICICILPLALSSQTQYSYGFADGYKNGYCYGDPACISPIAPVPPIPLIGESSTSYQDGYNRGFKTGQDNKRSSAVNNQSTSQPTYQPQTYQPQSAYVAPDYSAMQNYLERIQAQQDANNAYVDTLINWVYRYKSMSTEKQFLDSMNSDYNRLQKFVGQDIHDKRNEIRAVDLKIKADVDAYNTRLKIANDPNNLMEEGKTLYNQKNYSEAITRFDRVISSSPNYTLAYYCRGSSYFAMQNYQTAIVDFDKLIQLSPNIAYNYDRRGWSKYYTLDYYGALADFNKQIELDSTSSTAYYNRGSAKSQLGDENGAISDYTKAIKLNPNFSMAYNNRGWSKYELNKYNEALKDLNKAIELDSTNWVAYDSRQQTKFALNDLNGCLKDCNSAIQINPKCGNSFFYRGRVFYKMGQKEKSCSDWSKAGELGQKEAYDFIKKYCNN
jgi:tetratricopeptide (TPR) repeat protein